jgi:DNA-binding MarR family transcriptional regulator
MNFVLVLFFITKPNVSWCWNIYSFFSFYHSSVVTTQYQISMTEFLTLLFFIKSKSSRFVSLLNAGIRLFCNINIYKYPSVLTSDASLWITQFPFKILVYFNQKYSYHILHILQDIKVQKTTVNIHTKSCWIIKNKKKYRLKKRRKNDQD